MNNIRICHFIFCFCVFNLVFYTHTTPSLARNGSGTVLSTQFMYDLFYPNIDTESDKKHLALQKINNFDHVTYTKFKELVENSIHKNGIATVLSPKQQARTPFSATDYRFALWLRNIIDDRLGILAYERTMDGYIGEIIDGTTVVHYAFTNTEDERFTVIIGESTVEIRKKSTVNNQLWECFPDRVRLFLTRAEKFGSNVYFVDKIVALDTDNNTIYQ